VCGYKLHVAESFFRRQ